MTEQQFTSKLQKKFPYAYSLVPDYMWKWIFNNLIQKEI